LEVFNAIKTRRSINKVKQKKISNSIINKILESGIWAPNHHLTQPWKFFVISGEARNKLGEVMVKTLKDNLEEPINEVELEMKIEKEKNKPLRAPIIIIITVIPTRNNKIKEVEEICSGAAAAQNMLLTAHCLGIGAILRTGISAYDKNIKKFLGIKYNDHIIGFIYLGYPNMKNPKGIRIDYNEKTEWRNK